MGGTVLQEHFKILNWALFDLTLIFPRCQSKNTMSQSPQCLGYLEGEGDSSVHDCLILDFIQPRVSMTYLRCWHHVSATLRQHLHLVTIFT